MKTARRVSDYRGRRVYQFPVTAHVPVDLFSTRTVFDGTVTAYTPGDAARYVKQENATVPNLNITVYGPKGGRRNFFQGWHTAIGNAIYADGFRQIDLPLVDVAMSAAALHGIG